MLCHSATLQVFFSVVVYGYISGVFFFNWSECCLVKPMKFYDLLINLDHCNNKGWLITELRDHRCKTGSPYKNCIVFSKQEKHVFLFFSDNPFQRIEIFDLHAISFFLITWQKWNLSWHSRGSHWEGIEKYCKTLLKD